MPAYFCFCTDFGHLHTIEEIKKALLCINNHMRKGGCLVIEEGLPVKESNYFPPKTFYPKTQVYPDIKVWKTGDTRIDAATGRTYISQTVYIEDKNRHVKQFDHSFYLQSYAREAWLFCSCGSALKFYTNTKPGEGTMERGDECDSRAVKSEI